MCEGLGPSPRLLGRAFPADVKLMPFQSHFSHGVSHPSIPSRSETMSLTDVAPESFLDSGIYEDMRCRGCARLGRCNQPGRARKITPRKNCLMREAGCLFVLEARMSWDGRRESLREGTEAQTWANALQARARGSTGPECHTPMAQLPMVGTKMQRR